MNESMAPKSYGNGRFLYGEKGPTGILVQIVRVTSASHSSQVVVLRKLLFLESSGSIDTVSLAQLVPALQVATDIPYSTKNIS
jgi:hypothetical protein